jgi:hypothetical protein
MLPRRYGVTGHLKALGIATFDGDGRDGRISQKFVGVRVPVDVRIGRVRLGPRPDFIVCLEYPDEFGCRIGPEGKCLA